MNADSIVAIERRLRSFSQANLYLCAGELTQDQSQYVIERELMRRAGAKRKKEFFSGRCLARLALKRAGWPIQALDRGPLGNPIWPAHIIGSITHDQHFGMAVVTHDSEVQGIGIDLIENPGKVDRQIDHLIMHVEEELLLAARFPELPAPAVAFSVKEAVVKAVSVHIGRFMDFLDIQLTASDQGISARVNGFPRPIPCIVIATEFGLLSACFFRLRN
ncbi:4'-phosphopantetheinyl transferase superfamily protein [Marinobacter sp. M216]|uniref:Enterobactin synthase component D n=1 Tax=Marinobacter albus TaxID=3030833 RepID=A0ABT7HBI9_9GAMM|nr:MULTISPECIES: 4'-phosphopantetheinyl transferase superfamily protein [unclassified Marinobacter]MBW7470048.1 4'-phosphopantetheinyl transferase superfamily protein [Marinobacter sp. F4218]MDK9557688.1 4'-phosphopantetheinyl transferase superfamily protein [Marinobacter sp. M216]